MKTYRPIFVLIAALALFAGANLCAQQQNSPAASRQSQADMPGMNMGDMRQDASVNLDAAKTANDAMSDHDMHMSADMFMTDLRPHNASDDQRAAQLVETLRKSIAKYRDFKVALADGFRIFMPNLPQPLYHFTNYGYGYQAEFHFNPEQPTSLLYKKTQDGYELIGAMYTAPRSSIESQLDERVPLSVARWHKHINLCMPPKGAPEGQVNWKEFGFVGSIANQDACEQAGGRWFPQMFNWMVHVYPFETDSSKVWAH
jgi:hypothetical protein